MTIENETVAGALSAGIDTEARPLSDIKAMAEEILAHIDLHDAGETASTWLANAKSALRSALQYIEQHSEAIEAKAKAEVDEIEAKIGEPLSASDSAAAASVVASSGI